MFNFLMTNNYCIILLQIYVKLNIVIKKKCKRKKTVEFVIQIKHKHPSLSDYNAVVIMLHHYTMTK